MNWLTIILLLQEQYEEPGEITIFSLLCSGIALLILLGAVGVFASLGVHIFLSLLGKLDHRMTNQNTNTNAITNFAQRYIAFCNDPNNTAEGLREFYTNYLIWREMPHQFAPTGRTLGFAGMQTAFMEGKKLMAEQHYVLDNVVASEDAAALQIRWEMTLAQDLGNLVAGDKLSGNLAIFFRLEDGKIIQQTDYLSYDPR